MMLRFHICHQLENVNFQVLPMYFLPNLVLLNGVELRERPLLIILTPRQADNGRHSSLDGLDPSFLGINMLEPVLWIFPKKGDAKKCSVSSVLSVFSKHSCEIQPPPSSHHWLIYPLMSVSGLSHIEIFCISQNQVQSWSATPPPLLSEANGSSGNGKRHDLLFLLFEFCCFQLRDWTEQAFLHCDNANGDMFKFQLKLEK